MLKTSLNRLRTVPGLDHLDGVQQDGRHIRVCNGVRLVEGIHGNDDGLSEQNHAACVQAGGGQEAHRAVILYEYITSHLDMFFFVPYLYSCTITSPDAVYRRHSKIGFYLIYIYDHVCKSPPESAPCPHDSRASDTVASQFHSILVSSPLLPFPSLKRFIRKNLESRCRRCSGEAPQARLAQRQLLLRSRRTSRSRTRPRTRSPRLRSRPQQSTWPSGAGITRCVSLCVC